MVGRQCYHCKQWIEQGEEHDCWTTTEAALTEDLSEDLQEAYERLRETAVELGEQRIYASHHSIMFARSSCYFFVRPKKSYLEVVIFLGRALKAPQVKRADQVSKSSASGPSEARSRRARASGGGPRRTLKKVANFIRITHRDEVEPPITDWLHEAYDWVEKKKNVKRHFV